MVSNKSWKCWSSVVTALLVWGTTSLAAPPTGGLRYTVVVDKFENKSEDPQPLGDEWATLLTSALYESGQFIVIAQDDMQLKALKEQLRGLSGITTQGRKTAARGQMSPAQLLVKGVITHFQQGAANQGGGVGFGKVRINAGRKKTEIGATLQMIDASTGALVAARNFTGIAQQRAFSLQQQGNNQDGNVNMGEGDNVHAALQKAIAEVIPWMVTQLPSVPWRGSVVKVDSQRVIINRGSREGVSAGDEFVAGESEILRDPDTGEVLDEVVHERARIRVVQLGERTATCSVVNGDVGQIVVGMGIQYSREKG
jgi:curli biogenesis system outer membrane secretion channel CsgG